MSTSSPARMEVRRSTRSAPTRSSRSRPVLQGVSCTGRPLDTEHKEPGENGRNGSGKHARDRHRGCRQARPAPQARTGLGPPKVGKPGGPLQSQQITNGNSLIGGSSLGHGRTNIRLQPHSQHHQVLYCCGISKF